jgi:hypothetical protein
MFRRSYGITFYEGTAIAHWRLGSLLLSVAIDNVPFHPGSVLSCSLLPSRPSFLSLSLLLAFSPAREVV